MGTLLSHQRQTGNNQQHTTEGTLLRSALLADEVIMGLNAVGGGIGLMINGLGMPHSVLTHSPFDSFTFPGLLLTGVGVSLLTAARMVWKRRPLAPLASLAAGAVFLGWIVIETVMVRSGRELQIVIFLFALLTITLAWLMRQRTDA